MKAERIPIDKLNIRKQKLGEKNKLVNSLTKMMSSLKSEVMANSNAQSLREVLVETNEEIIGVDLDKNVVQPGTHQIEVMS